MINPVQLYLCFLLIACGAVTEACRRVWRRTKVMNGVKP
ncbi:hypothetical protein QFZ84_005013 [Pseudomonas fluorescens]